MATPPDAPPPTNARAAMPAATPTTPADAPPSASHPRYQRRGMRSSGRLGVGLLFGFVALGMGPVAWTFLSPWSRVNSDRPLPSQAAVRGAYVNAGSQDAGPDRSLSALAAEEEEEAGRAGGRGR